MRGVWLVHVQVCGDPVTGIWCDRCLRPSGIGLVIAINGLPHVKIECHDCGAKL